MRRTILFSLSLLIACSGKSEDSGTASTTEGGADEATGSEGDGGTGSRVVARIKEFMRDTSQRGGGVILMLTNRPDKLDADLKRPGRFDLKIPFFFPEDITERKAVLEALARKNKLTLAEDADLDGAAEDTAAENTAAPDTPAPESLEDEVLDADAAEDLDDDGDGVLDVTDNCQFMVNPLQEDFELDGIGDVCDSDDDGDFVGDDDYDVL